MLSEFQPETLKALIKQSLTGRRGSFHVTRLFMYKHLRDKLKDHDGPDKHCLAISHSKRLGQILGLNRCKYGEANYPEYRVDDLKLDSERFNFCVSDQVFEHVEGNPFTAFAETVRVVKPGGFVCHTTCFINPIHRVPKDFWRFTPDALALLATSARCDVIDVGGWGNREAWAMINLGYRMTPIPDDEMHPLYKLAMRNEPSWPIVTWVIARKP